jgi:hypothetical protein
VRWGSSPFFRKSIRKLLMDEQWSLLSQNKDAGRVAQPAGESLSTRSPGKGAEEHQTGKLGRERRAGRCFRKKKGDGTIQRICAACISYPDVTKEPCSPCASGLLGSGQVEGCTRDSTVVVPLKAIKKHRQMSDLSAPPLPFRLPTCHEKGPFSSVPNNSKLNLSSGKLSGQGSGYLPKMFHYGLRMIPTSHGGGLNSFANYCGCLVAFSLTQKNRTCLNYFNISYDKMKQELRQ